MPHSQYTADQIVQRGQYLYETRLRLLMKSKDIGNVLVIDVETGDYELDTDDIAAAHRLQAKHPGAALYAMRVGSPTFGRIGRQEESTSSC